MAWACTCAASFVRPSYGFWSAATFSVWAVQDTLAKQVPPSEAPEDLGAFTTAFLNE